MDQYPYDEGQDYMEWDYLEWDDYICAVTGCGETAVYEGWAYTYRSDGSQSPIKRRVTVCPDHVSMLIGRV